MKYELLGQEIEITEGIINSMKIRKDFIYMAAKESIEFMDDYHEADKDIILAGTFVEMYDKKYNLDALDELVMKYVRQTRAYLSKYGIYTLTDETIWENAIINNDRKESLLRDCFDRVNRKLDCEDVEADGTFIGELGSLGNSSHRTLELRKMFESGYFSAKVEEQIMVLYDYVEDILDDNDIIELDYVTQEDADKASAIYTNLTDGCVNPSDREALVCALIELDPTEDTYYEYVFINYPEERETIIEITNTLCLDISDVIEEVIMNSFDLRKITCEDEAVNMMNELKETMQKYGISESPREKELNNILVEYDIKARTFDGILYETRELCANASKDDKELKEICGNIAGLGKPECQELLNKIGNLQVVEAIKQKYLNLLNDRVYECDEKYLLGLVSDINICVEEECNKIKEQINAYDTENKELKAKVLSRVDMRIHLIWDAEDFKKFTGIYKDTQPSNAEQVAESYKIVSKTGRTGCKDAFLKALSSLNPENVEIAAKYAMAKDGFFSSIVNMGKKDIYLVLTLEEKVIHPAITEKIDELKNEKPKGLFGGIKKSLFGGFGSSKKAEEPAKVTVKAKFCSECGEKLAEGARFCPSCGKKVE